MDGIYEDIILYIWNDLSFADLSRFTIINKSFMEKRSSDYYLKRKDKFHDPNKTFEINKYGSFPCKKYDILMNQYILSHIWDS